MFKIIKPFYLNTFVNIRNLTLRKKVYWPNEILLKAYIYFIFYLLHPNLNLGTYHVQRQEFPLSRKYFQGVKLIS